MRDAWSILGLDPGADERSVKRAYAALLKRTRPEDDAVAYQALRRAYEHALAMAKRAGAPAPVTPLPRPASLAPAPEVPPPAPLRRAPAPAPAPAPAAAPAPEPARPAVRRHVAAPPAAIVPEPPAIPAHPEPETAAPGAVRATFAVPQLNHEALAGAELHAWLAQPGGVTPEAVRASLQERLRGETLTDLRTREAFELLAARHCAQPACPAEVRAVLVEELGWHEDALHLQRLDEVAIDTALARWRADRSIDALQARGASDSALGFLLSGHMPRLVPQMMDAGFVRRMRAALEEIRWQHADALRFRLDAAVVAAWQARVDRKRYTAQTLFYSFLAGLALAAALRPLLGDATDPVYLGAACQALAIGATALYVLLAPPALRARVTRLQSAIVGRLAQDNLHGKLIRGWIAAASLGTLLLFADLPGIARPALLLACAAVGLLLMAPLQVPGLYLLIGLQAGVVGAYLHVATDGAYGLASMLAACTSLTTIKMFRIRQLTALRARLGTGAARVSASWLAGCVLLVLVSRNALLPAAQLAPLTWALLVTGVLYVSAALSILVVIPLGITLHLALNYIVLPPAALAGTLPQALELVLLMLAARAAYDWHQTAQGATLAPPQ